MGIAQSRRAGWAYAVAALGLVLVTVGFLRDGPEEVDAKESAGASAGPATGTTKPPVVLQMPGEFPKSGPRTFVIGKTPGPVLGNAGTLKRFRIAVETNAAEEIDVFTEMVDQTLADPRSWIAGNQVRFQRVPDGSAYDFTVYLATRETAQHMCNIGGIDIRQDGIPYTSCRQVRQVIINLDRWRLSVPEYVNLATPLETYRQYVINHEVGHELGRGHESCPGAGQLAPTMVRQTLGLEGCLPNAWPYVNGKRYSGPPVP